MRVAKMKKLFLASCFLFLTVFAGFISLQPSLKPVLADEISFGDLTIIDPWIKAAHSGKPVTAGYLTIRNNGSADDYLLGASAEFSHKTEIHEMKMSGEVMQMRPLPDGMVIPAGEIVMLKPGGYHVMFMGLSQPIHENDNVEIELNFKNAGSVSVMFEAKNKHSHSH
jgi:copper(I)-binding protein